MSDVALKSPKAKRISEADFRGTEFTQSFYTACVAEGFTRDEMLNPLVWVHVAKQLRAMDEIRAYPKDGAWYGRYLVLFADPVRVVVKELEFHKLDGVPVEDSDDYRVKWAGTSFRVIRAADNAVMKDGFSRKDDATEWMRTNLRVKAA